MDRSNQEWVEALRGETDEAALSELRRRLLAGLRGAMQGNTSVDDSLLEDAVQETLIKILGSIESFRGDSRFLTWSLTIASRTVWTELRRKRWKDVSLQDVAAADDLADRPAGDPDFAAKHDWQALQAVLNKTIDTELTERQRTAILAELSGMPQEEIARRMDSNRNAIYKLVHDARRNLKRGLEKAGYGAEEVLSAAGR